MRILKYMVIAGLGLALLSGCGSPGGTQTPGANNPPASGTHPTDSGTANVDMSVMAEATVGAFLAGGTVTVVLRSVVVGNNMMTVRFAIQWDNDDARDDATDTDVRVGIALEDLMVVDREGLVAYRPLCTKGSYAGDVGDCRNSQLISPSAWMFQFRNHVLVEGFALLPVPQGHPATVEVFISAPFPPFTNATVTYE